jgi:CRP/FNR family cyclic AMP-dependent transcriptional regulator
VARLPEAAFRDMVIKHPNFAWTLLEHLSAQLRRMTDRVYEFSTLVVRERLIAELLHLAEEFEPVDGQVFISPAPTHSELASKISTHREEISRAMSGLAKSGLVEKRGVILLPWKGSMGKSDNIAPGAD